MGPIFICLSSQSEIAISVWLSLLIRSVCVYECVCVCV